MNNSTPIEHHEKKMGDRTNRNGKLTVQKRIGDAIERAGNKIERSGFKKLGDRIERLGDKIEHSGERKRS